MNRSLKFSLDNGNTGKLQSIDALFGAYAKLVNHYISLLAEGSKYVLREEVQAKKTPLSTHYKQCAARQATMIWKAWRRTWRRGCQRPTFTGAMQLDQRFLEIQCGKNSFDYWVKVSTVTKRMRISIPFKSYDYANHYFDHWTLRKGGKIQIVNLLTAWENINPSPRFLVYGNLLTKKCHNLFIQDK
jgi:hypothetical protein